MMKQNLVILVACMLSLQSVAQQYGSFKDTRDGKVYKTVKIGGQEWMAENLNVSKFRNGDLIPEAKTDEEWEKAGVNKQPVWCYFSNDPKNQNQNGKLYNYYAIIDERGLAPANWRILNNDDWSKLNSSLGLEYASRIKSKSGWINNFNGTNKSGFSVYPSGCRADNGRFIGFGDNAVYLSLPVTDDDVFTKKVIVRNAILHAQYPSENFGYSVRCLANREAQTNDKIIIELPPDIENIKSKLSEFSFILPSNKVSIEEARKILIFLGANEITSYTTFIVGRFNDEYAVTIWPGTYGKNDTYGIRFGDLDLRYHGSNDTYFEISKYRKKVDYKKKYK